MTLQIRLPGRAQPDESRQAPEDLSIGEVSDV